MTYAFTHMGNFLLLLLLLLLLRTPPPSKPSLEAQIPVLRPKSHPQGPNSNPKAQIPVSRDLGLKTGIWASRLGYGPPGWDMGLEAGGRGEGCGGGEGGGGGENSPYVWKHRSSTPLGPLPCSPLNFEHNLVRQCTGTTDHLTLLRLFLSIILTFLLSYFLAFFLSCSWFQLMHRTCSFFHSTETRADLRSKCLSQRPSLCHQKLIRCQFCSSAMFDFSALNSKLSLNASPQKTNRISSVSLTRQRRSATWKRRQAPCRREVSWSREAGSARGDYLGCRIFGEAAWSSWGSLDGRTAVDRIGAQRSTRNLERKLKDAWGKRVTFY